jgi:hypothetical protein
MLLMDGMPDWMPPPRSAQPLVNARQYQRVLDGYAHIGAAAGHRPGQVSLSDAAVRNASSRSEAARQEMIVHGGWPVARAHLQRRRSR